MNKQNIKDIPKTEIKLAEADYIFAREELQGFVRLILWDKSNDYIGRVTFDFDASLVKFYARGEKFESSNIDLLSELHALELLVKFYQFMVEFER